MLRKSRRFAAGLAAALVTAGLAGCEALHQFGRRSASERSGRDPALEAVDEREDSGETSSAARRFFKNNRLPGALSSEGAEIERDMGIYR